MPFAAAWMSQWSQVRERKKNIWYHLHVESKVWYKWTYLQHKNRLTHIVNKLTVIKGEGRPCVCSVVSDSLWPQGLYVRPQVALSTGFPGQEYWSGLPFPAPGDLPDPGIKSACLVSTALGDFTTGATWKTQGEAGWGDKLGVGDYVYTLLYVEWTIRRDLLYSTGNYIQHFVITYKGKESEKQ